MPVYDFLCQCGNEFDSIEKQSVKKTDCPECGDKADRIFPKKGPSFNLTYNPKSDTCDWNGNTTRYWDDYKKMKSEGKKPRIPALDGDG